MPSGDQDNGSATGDYESSIRPQRGIIGLVAKAEALVEHVQDLLHRLERDGEVVVEMQTTLRIQVPRPVTREGNDAS